MTIPAQTSLTASTVMAFLAIGLNGCQPPDVPVQERIANIEGAILPAFTIQGQPANTTVLLDLMDQLGVPGVSVAVINKGAVEWAKGFGLADVASRREVTPETLFQAASISKPLAGMAALDMVEDGLLGLDQNVNELLTQWAIPDNQFTTDRKVTLRGILTHSAGTTVWGFPGYERDAPTPDAKGVLNGEGNTDPVRVYREPGEGWQYSGGGYTVMQLMLSDLDDMPFPQLMAQRVLQPLGMNNSTYEQPLPETLHNQAATGYRNGDRPVNNNWHVYPEMAAAGLWTTPSDLARYLLEIQRTLEGSGGAVLNRETVQAMLTPADNNWGLGPSLQSDVRFGHGGSNEGFRCVMTAFLDRGQGAIIMTNSENGSRLAGQILNTIAREYGWPEPAPPEKVGAVLSPEQLAALAGTYRFNRIVEATVAVEGKGLSISLPRRDARIILPESDSLFFFQDNGDRVEFVREAGMVTTMIADGRRAEKIH